MNNNNHPIDELDFTVRTWGILKYAGVTTIEQLVQLDDDNLMRMRHMEQKCIDEIHAKLNQYFASNNKEATTNSIAFTVSVNIPTPTVNNGNGRLTSAIVTEMRAKDAITTAMQKVNLTAFISDTSIDDVLSKDLINELGVAKAIQTLATLQAYVNKNRMRGNEVCDAIETMMPILERAITESKYKLHIIETNIDGCGGSCDMYVEFDTTLSDEQSNQFKEMLTSAKEHLEDTDTEGFINEAIEQFQSATGITGKLIDPPYNGFIEF